MAKHLVRGDNGMVHYHGTPCGGSRQDVARFLAARHAMVPFPRPDDLPVAADVCQSFVLDNGAFSVWKKGGEVEWDAYLDFVDRWRKHPGFDWAIIPDEIEGGELANDELVYRWPSDFAGVPVWHFHESVDRLRRLCGAFRTVALGSSGRWPTPGTQDWWNRVCEFMPAIVDDEGRPMCKLHGLRMLNPEIFSRLPLSSADSTNAAQNAGLTRRFGTYPPPTQAQRMAVIADRIEAYQSMPRWVQDTETDSLWSLCP